VGVGVFAIPLPPSCPLARISPTSPIWTMDSAYARVSMPAQRARRPLEFIVIKALVDR
jgi:hypothetical protein